MSEPVSIDDAFLRGLWIATADSRLSRRWKSGQTTWGRLTDKLRIPHKLNVTAAAYRAASVDERHALKDCGGWVAGQSVSGSRKKSDITGSRILRLDMDAAPVEWHEVVRAALEGLVWAAHTTASHTPEKPRVRVLVPVSRDLTADEYEYLARSLAERIGAEYWPDATTWRRNQMVFWPTVTSGGEFLFAEGTGKVFDVDAYLAGRPDWEDISTWPMSEEGARRPGTEAEDPREKRGWVGAWCRTYDLHQAIDELLPGIYTRGDTPDRYSFASGSTRNGLVVYGEGRWAYSYHSISDPAAGQLLNSWDLVRIHLYGHLDEAFVGPPGSTKAPSSRMMLKLAEEDSAVKELVARERIADAAEFGVVEGDAPVDSVKMLTRMTLAADTYPEKTHGNLCLILRYDPRFSGVVRFNIMTGAVESTGKWPDIEKLAETKPSKRKSNTLTDAQSSRLRCALEKVYRRDWTSTGIYEAVTDVAEDAAYDPLLQELDATAWDGVKRLDMWLSDYCGAEDSEYTRQVSRKFLVQAVSRARIPGVQADHMLLLHGIQGAKKTSLCRALALRDEFFAELVKGTSAKEAEETAAGVWIVEMGEMDWSTNSDAATLKSFVSRRDERHRHPHEKWAETTFRRCVIIGTANKKEILKDSTGNRRFWSIDVSDAGLDLDGLRGVVRQLYAEADVLRIAGEHMWLEGEAAAAAVIVQEAHRQVDEWEVLIANWLDKPVSEDVYDRYGDYVPTAAPERPRTRVCIQEILTDCLGVKPAQQTREIRYRVGGCLRTVVGWEQAKSTLLFGKRFGMQKGWVKTGVERP